MKETIMNEQEKIKIPFEIDLLEEQIEGIENEFLKLKKLPYRIKECETEIKGFHEQIEHTSPENFDNVEDYEDELNHNENEIIKWKDYETHYREELETQCEIIMEELEEIIKGLEN